MKAKRAAKPNKIIVIALICAILVSVIFIATMSYTVEKEVADIFYLQIYNDEGEVASKYRLSLTGKISSEGSEILTVSLEYVSGDACETSYSITGSRAAVTMTHSEYGYLTKTVLLDIDGAFSVLE